MAIGAPSRRGVIAGLAAMPVAASARMIAGDPLVPATDPATIPSPPAQAPQREATIEVPGGHLFYWDTGGSGVPIVLMHPLTGSALSWPYQQPVLAAAGYRVIGWSQRGAYRSGPAPVGLDAQLGDLAALVDALKLPRFHLVGAAAGAFLALRFALAHSDRLLSLTIACSLGGLGEPDYLTMLRRIQPPGLEALPVEARELGPSYRAANPAGVARWLEIERDAISHIPSTGHSLASLANGPRYADLARLALPVSLIFGDADLYAPPAIGRVLASKIAGSRLSIIAEAGHSAFWEQPAAFNSILLRALRHRS